MVGGFIIETKLMRLKSGRDVIRIWCIDRKNSDECAVFADPSDEAPKVGDQCWWQSGFIYFDQDRKKCRKIGFSFDPRERA